MNLSLRSVRFVDLFLLEMASTAPQTKKSKGFRSKGDSGHILAGQKASSPQFVAKYSWVVFAVCAGVPY